MPDPQSITLRPVSPEDERFLLEIYATTRAQELALTDWNEQQRRAFVEMQFAAQQMYYRTQFPGAEHSIILIDNRPSGRLYVDRRPEEIRILDITLAAQQRNGGVGSAILKGLMKEALERGKSVRIYVERLNPSLRLFERLGFSIIESTPSHLLMEWRQRAAGEGGPSGNR